jgi:hypothetical protein
MSAFQLCGWQRVHDILACLSALASKGFAGPRSNRPGCIKISKNGVGCSTFGETLNQANESRPRNRCE